MWKMLAFLPGNNCSNRVLLIYTRYMSGEFPMSEISRPRTADNYGD